MTVIITHPFVSAIPDGDDDTIVRPSNWNADHTIEGLGTAAEADTGDFATAAQGALAGTALQPAAIGVSVQAYDTDLSAWAGVNPSSYSTTAQIAAAYQPLDSDLTAWAGVNPSSYSTSTQIAAAYQPLDSGLTALAAFNTNGIIVQSANNTFVGRSIAVTASTGLGVTNGDGVSGNPTLAGVDASTTVKGVVELATNAETQTGTDAVRAVTPAGLRSATREFLLANRTYYVRSDGSNSNDGLADTAGGAFLTIAKAITTVSALDLSTFSVTIQVQDGTWTVGASVTAPWVGSGVVTLRGNPSTPANCTISSATPISTDGVGTRLTVTGFTIVSSAVGLTANNGSTLTLGSGMVFGACTTAHMRALGLGSSIIAQSVSYSITGASARHFLASPQGYISIFGATITLSGTLAFSTAFAFADRFGFINAGSASISGGTITGKRYDASLLAIIYTAGGGASFFPGDVVGTTATGAQYA